MDTQSKPREEKEIIVMGLSLTYAVCVGIFAVIRYYKAEYPVAMMDTVLALFGVYVFALVWRTRSTHLPSMAISFISVFGTIATISLKGPEQIYWAYPSVALVFYLLPTRQAVILWTVSAVFILYQLIDLSALKLVTIVMTLFITSFFCHLFSSTMTEQHERLRKIANQDVLTQVKNRRAFNQDTSFLEDFHGIVSAILFDLDNFKQVNDFYGHAKGDKVLKTASVFVNKVIENKGVLYRIGGDEFAVLCEGQDFNHAYQLAKEIYQSVSESDINQQHNITLSLAVAQKEHNESVKEWLGRLDSALYKAKKSGRNQIVKSVRY
ncbi:MAG: GGDEF domain-containing protein [Marinicella sp.]|nr:GGDEF domain-containing protein [Xanthomonadales bacterium]